jgi:hypothetical protein
VIDDQTILEKAQSHFQKVHPEMCIRVMEGVKQRDPYYLDHPERSDTMTAYIEGAKWVREETGFQPGGENR